LRRALDGQLAACVDAVHRRGVGHFGGGLGGWLDGVQALVARAMMQRMAICGRCMSINHYLFFFKTINGKNFLNTISME
jgi:hypothetical protein